MNRDCCQIDIIHSTQASIKWIEIHCSKWSRFYLKTLRKYSIKTYYRTIYLNYTILVLLLDGLDGWYKMQSAQRGQHGSGKHYNNHHFNHHHNHISPNHGKNHYRQRRHGGNNLHHSSNGFDVYHEWTPSQQSHSPSVRNKRKGRNGNHGTTIYI